MDEWKSHVQGGKGGGNNKSISLDPNGNWNGKSIEYLGARGGAVWGGAGKKKHTAEAMGGRVLGEEPHVGTVSESESEGARGEEMIHWGVPTMSRLD